MKLPKGKLFTELEYLSSFHCDKSFDRKHLFIKGSWEASKEYLKMLLRIVVLNWFNSLISEILKT